MVWDRISSKVVSEFLPKFMIAPFNVLDLCGFQMLPASLSFNKLSVRNKGVDFVSLPLEGFSQPIARRLFLEKASLQHSVPLSEASKNSVFRSKRQNRSLTPKKRPRIQVQTHVGESQVRRSTRQSVRNNGYKLEPMRDNPTPKKK
jgi:hypothetical protein